MLIGYENPELCSHEKRLQNTLTALFDLIDFGDHPLQVWRWTDGTLEITCGQHNLWVRDNRVYTPKTKNFDNIPAEQKTEIHDCRQTHSQCNKGCGCGCLLSLGYIECEPDDSDGESDFHCHSNPT
jgi:hypothetical protein